MSRPVLPKWITLDKAAEIEGADSTKTLAEWVSRWNSRLDTQHKVARRHGKVELHSLLNALDEDSAQFSQGEEVRTAYRSANKRSERSARAQH